MSSQVTHVMIDINLVFPKSINFGPKTVNIFSTLGIFLSNFSLMIFKLSPNIYQESFEVFGIIKDKSIYNSLVDLY